MGTLAPWDTLENTMTPWRHLGTTAPRENSTTGEYHHGSHGSHGTYSHHLPISCLLGVFEVVGAAMSSGSKADMVAGTAVGVVRKIRRKWPVERRVGNCVCPSCHLPRKNKFTLNTGVGYAPVPGKFWPEVCVRGKNITKQSYPHYI